jgi:hypothetical protein
LCSVRWLFVLLILTVMVNNSTNINKTKESLNSDDQQFHQYQQKKVELLTTV